MVLCGLETHICVLQTALDLVAAGFEVTLACDAVSSHRCSLVSQWNSCFFSHVFICLLTVLFPTPLSRPHDRAVALARLSSCAGVTLSTSESIIFQWLESADHPHFRQVSALVKSAAATDSCNNSNDDFALFTCL